MSKEFKESLEKKSKLESELEILEQQIYALETHYLEETQHTGNIIKGWEGYFTLKTNKSSNVQPKKNTKVSANDRIFSLSSTTSPAQNNVEDNNDRNISQANGFQQSKSKRNKNKKKHYEGSKRADSPSRNDQESSMQEEYIESGLLQEEDSEVEQRSKSKKLIKKTIKKSKNGQK